MSTATKTGWLFIMFRSIQYSDSAKTFSPKLCLNVSHVTFSSSSLLLFWQLYIQIWLYPLNTDMIRQRKYKIWNHLKKLPAVWKRLCARWTHSRFLQHFFVCLKRRKMLTNDFQSFFFFLHNSYRTGFNLLRVVAGPRFLLKTILK